MTDKERQVIEALVASVDKAYHKPKLLMWRSFLMGLLSGLGGTIGVAIVVAILGIIVREFGGVPVIGQILQDLGNVLSGIRN